jgi:hypothetical protein
MQALQHANEIEGKGGGISLSIAQGKSKPEVVRKQQNRLTISIK